MITVSNEAKNILCIDIQPAKEDTKQEKGYFSHQRAGFQTFSFEIINKQENKGQRNGLDLWKKG